jgi:hypothetical protein
LTKQEILTSANQLSKNRNLAKLTSPHGNIRAPIAVGISMGKPGGMGEKRNKE